jgi:O-antigen/teichoic acid export membrane protein
VLLPRYLGDVNFGKLMSAIALTSLLGMVVDLGATTYLTKEVARDPRRASTLTLNLLVLRVPLSVIAGGLAVIVAHLAGYDALTRTIIYILTLGTLVTSLAALAAATLQGLQRMKALAATNILSKVGYAVAAAALLLAGGGAVAVAGAWVGASLLSLVVSLVVLWRYVGVSTLWASLNWRTWRRLLLAGLPFLVWQAALLVYGQIDTVLLSVMAHDAVVGWYAAAYRIVMIPVFIPTVVLTVIFPALSAATGDAPTFNALARRAVHVVALVCVPMGLGIMLLAGPIITALGYPASFVHSTIPLILLAPHLPLAAIDSMIGTVLNTQDRQRQWAVIGVAAAVLNPLLNLAAIPYTAAAWGNGAIGAAAITTLTEVFMMVGGLWLLPRGVFGRSTLSDVSKSLVASAVMGVVVLLTRDLPILVPVALGGLVYAAVALGIGAVSWGDLKQVQVYLMRRQALPQASY